jgi:hypothetical protein
MNQDQLAIEIYTNWVDLKRSLHPKNIISKAIFGELKNRLFGG